MATASNNVLIRIECASALTFEADILVLKYAQELYGLDWEVVQRLERVGARAQGDLPQDGDHHLVNSMQQVGSTSVLFVGVGDLFHFRYREIREFAHRALAVLSEEAPETKHICITLHGANYGLDETEAFESELAGLADALNSDSYPSELERITIVELKPERAERLESVLSELFPTGSFSMIPEPSLDDQTDVATERLRAAGYGRNRSPAHW